MLLGYFFLYFFVASFFKTFQANPENTCTWTNKGESPKKSCKQNCYFTRTRLKCGHGAIVESINNCSNLPSICPGSNFHQTNVITSCRGVCDHAIEKVTLQCATNSHCSVIQTRYCTNVTGCKGEWTSWSSSDTCDSTTKGYVELERKCLDRKTKEPTSFCQGSRRANKQKKNESCDKPCGRAISGKRCHCHCPEVVKTITSKQLLSKCELAKKQDNKTCRQKSFLISCKKNVESSVCSLADGTFCYDYLPWETWAQWNKSEKQMSRSRWRWCSHPLPNIFANIPCQYPLQIEEECLNKEVPLNLFNSWPIPVIIFATLIFLIVLCCLLCRHRKRVAVKRKRNSTFDSSSPKKLPFQKYENESNIRDKKKLESQQTSSVFERMNHVPDYDYGTVLKKNLTSFKQQSKEKKAAASNQEANESNYDIQVIDPNLNKNKSIPRIAVTITNPDGIQVGGGVYKANAKDENLKKNIPLPNRNRWSKVPTPVPTDKPSFFNEVSAPSKTKVLSVRYSAVNPNLEPPSKSRLSSNNGETLHRYDPVPSDKVKYSLRSAHSSMGASSDTWSVFSQSSFEGDWKDEEMADCMIKNRFDENNEVFVGFSNELECPGTANSTSSKCLTNKSSLAAPRYSHGEKNRTQSVVLQPLMEGSPCREVDPKYVCPSSLHGLQSENVLPTDHTGYFHLEAAP